MPQLIGMQLATIDSVLTACAERHLNDEHLTVTDLNLLVRTLSSRKSKFFLNPYVLSIVITIFITTFSN